MTIDVDIHNDQVWSWILNLFELAKADPSAAQVKIVCGTCGSRLAKARPTTRGPIFVSSWEMGHVQRRDTARVLAALPAIEKSGQDIANVRGRNGYLAALALPPELPQVYPPLLVRCPEHGDAILNRSELVQSVRRNQKRLKATVMPPFHEVTTQRTDGLPKERSVSRQSHQLGSGAVPLAQFNDWWRSASTPGA